MSNSANRRHIWKQHFPVLFDSDDVYIKQLIEASKLINVAAKQRVIMPGSHCKDYLLVAEGRMRVQFLTKPGREVVLYHLNPGDDCVLTTSCLFADEGFPAEGVTETDVTVIAISASIFHETLQKSVIFRQFVFSTFSRRLTDVISRMETLCSASIEQQLANVLLLLSKEYPVINITHQELASEIGTVREVVSRHLKKFENKQWIRMSRGKIELVDKAKLQKLIP